MLLYHIHDWQQAVLSPWRFAAEAAQAAFQNPFVPASYTQAGRAIAAGAELFERSTRNFHKPAFGLSAIKFRGKMIDIREEVVDEKPFCRLLHFKRSAEHPDIAKKLLHDPKVLVVAPMSGHHATLLRGTVEALLQEHDVYITDWTDAKLVPLSKGHFDLEDYIEYVMEFIRFLAPDVHLLAVCQPAVPVLCAAAILAEMKDPAQPSSMTLMGGPIDTRVAKTVVTELARKKDIDWFRNTVIHALPFYYPGAYRMVYPGFIQLNGFMSMNMERHIGEYFKLFQNLVRGDDDSVTKHREFYDEYLSVMDTTAEFYLQTVERVFQTHDLPEGKFMCLGQLVKPQLITRTALLTIEGELDDISAPGQTRAAHDLCTGLSKDMKVAHLEIGVGHYGIFNGRRWRERILPVVRDFIRAHGNNSVEAGSHLKVVHSKG